MAPSQPNATSSPHPHTAGPSTASSSTTSPTGTHSTVATTVGNRQRSWDEDKNLHLYILDYCRRRKFDDTAMAFEREARISPDSKINFEAPQGLLFEWWIVFWETFNSQRSQLASPAGQGESSQVYVNTMARLKKLAMHEKDEQNRTRSMSMSQMPGPMMGGMAPVMNGSGTASTMSTPAMGHMPNPMGGPRPPSQASARIPQQPGIGQPGNPPMGPGASGPGMGPQQQGPGMPPGQMNGPPQQPGMSGQQPGMQQRPPQPGMAMPPGGMQMTPNMTHPSPHVSTPSAPHVSSTPSPAPTPPQTFPGGGPGSQQPPFNPQFNPSQPQFQPGSGQPPFPGQQGQFPPGNPQFRQGPGPNGPPGQNGPFPPGASGPGFQPGAGGPSAQNFGGQPGPGFPPGPGQQQSFPSGPGGQFPSGPGIGGPGGPGGPGTLGPAGPGAPGGHFPPGSRPGIPFQNNRPEWGQQPPPMGGPEQRRPDGSWEEGRGRPGPGPGMMGQQPKIGTSHPSMQQYLGRPGGPPPHMMQPGMTGPQMGGPIPSPSPKDDNRSVTPQQTQAGWNPEGPGPNMQRRAGMAAQGGQVGPGGRPGPGPGGFNPQGPGPQKRPGSPQPPATTNLGGSPPDPKRPRPNDPGPGVLVDSRVGPDGRPTSSKGMPFPGPGGPGMNGAQQQLRLNGEQQYSQELRSTTAEMRGQVLRQGGPQPPPFGGKGQQNGRGSRPPDVPSPASGGEGPGQPRQVMNVKGQASGSMGPPASPGLAHRGVKKSDSEGNSPALPPSTVPNGMNPGDRSHTPQQMKSDTHSPMPAPMTRPQSAQPTSMNQGPSFVPAPTGSAPPMLPTNPAQSPNNNMLSFDAKLAEQFDFGPGMGLPDFTGDFLSDMDPMFQLGDWNDNE